MKDEFALGQWPSGYITANGIRIHYTRTGGDKPPVVRLSPASHNVRREQFAGFIQAVRAFLKENN